MVIGTKRTGLSFQGVWLLLFFVFGMVFLQDAMAKKGLAVFDAAPVSPPPKAPLPFDVLGFLEEATVDRENLTSVCEKAPADPRLAGGRAKVNGIYITIPCNTIIQMPATSMTWADLFDSNPSASTSSKGQTGLAMIDTETLPLSALPPYNGTKPTYEIHIQGNIIKGRYVAGLVFIAQQSLNTGQGKIESIDYKKGQLMIKTRRSGHRGYLLAVRINDPIGRFGIKRSGEKDYDPRFTADTDNPTVHAVTGFPMCIPRSNPFSADEGDDPLCPESNRPRAPNCKSLPEMLAGRVGFPPFTLPADGQYCRQFMMEPPSPLSADCSGPECQTDPTRQAPFEVGDFISYSGVLKTDVNEKNEPYSYISAHSIVANLGIYTASGIPPAYVAIEESLVGTNALPLADLPQEATSLVRIEGFSTDPSALVDIFMVDVDYETGEVSNRWIGTENPGLPPVLGRFRFRPVAGSYGPFTRDIRVVSRTACRSPSQTCADELPKYANGIQAGQYRAPNFEFIFPEPTRTGDPMVPNNFQDFYFLYCGSGPLGQLAFDEQKRTTPLVGPLDPAPWAAPMTSPIFADKCPPPNDKELPKPTPIVTMSANQSVLGSTVVTLSGTATDPLGTSLSTYKWTQISGTPVTLVDNGSPKASTATFTAPVSQGVLVFELSVTNANGQTGTGKVTVAVNPDQVTIVSAKYDNRKGKGVLNVIATSSLPGRSPGLSLFIEASNETFNLSSEPQKMTLIANTEMTPGACPGGFNPCWQYTVTGVLRNTISTSFLPPTSITVTSSKGGSTTIDSASILVQ